MASYFVTSIAPGQWFYVTDATPAATISAPRGSLAIRTDVGEEALYINVTAGGSPGANWERILSPDINGVLNLEGVGLMLLADNSASGLDIGTLGLLNLLRFITTNGAEQVAYNGIAPFLINTGGLNVVAGTVALPQASLDVASAAKGIASGIVGASLELRVSHPGGNGFIDTVLPARAGGFRVTDVRAVSGGNGGAGATITVQTAAGASNVSSALDTNGTAAGAMLRTTSITNSAFASGATIRVQGGAVGLLASNVYITLEPT